MTPFVLRGIAALLWVSAVFLILGGAFVWREPLRIAGREDGTTDYRISLYGRLSRPPPSCDLLTVSRLSLAMPCDFRPPFIDLAKTYF